MNLGSTIHCGECGKVTVEYWTIINTPATATEKEPSEPFVDARILCSVCYTKFIVGLIKDRVDPSFKMGVRQLYIHIFGPRTDYDKHKMRVLLDATAIVIDEIETEKENTDEQDK